MKGRIAFGHYTYWKCWGLGVSVEVDFDFWVGISVIVGPTELSLGWYKH